MFNKVMVGIDEHEGDRADKVLAAAAGESGVDATLRSIGSRSVGRGLHELVERDGADLLVVGSTRTGLLGRCSVTTRATR
jgi:nucleotide-binding universal stress UspA family protein